MNNLSWIIYLGNLLGNLQNALMAINILGTIGIGIILMFLLLNYDTSDELLASLYGKLSFVCLYLVYGVMFLTITLIFFPSPKTFYMIAASEVAEKMVTQPETKEMLLDLKELIQENLKDK